MQKLTAEPIASQAAPGQLRAIGLMCLAWVLFACLDTTAKWLSHSVPVMEVVWARYVGAMVFAMLVVKPLSAPNVLHTSRFWLQAGRSFTLFASTVLNFFALQYLQLAETVSIASITRVKSSSVSWIKMLRPALVLDSDCFSISIRKCANLTYSARRLFGS